mgnify:FL=1
MFGCILAGFLLLFGVVIFVLNVKQQLGYSLHITLASGVFPFLWQLLYCYGANMRLETTVLQSRAGRALNFRTYPVKKRTLKRAMHLEGMFET